MTREQLEHIIRASASIVQSDAIVVIGSQSILGAYPEAPAALRMSMEADVYPRDKPEASELIDGAIGEGSAFHETFGYYAQGVGPSTAVLPKGWADRVVQVANANTRGAVGLCLSPADLALAKCVANREKDQVFVKEMIAHGLVRVDELVALSADLPVASEVRARIVGFVSR